MVKSKSLRRFLAVLSIVGISLSAVGCANNSKESGSETPNSSVEASNFKTVEFV